MRFPKILTLVLAGCLLCGSLIACDKGDSNETDAATTAADTTATTEKNDQMTITLTVKEGSTRKYKKTVTFKGTLGDAIEVFTLNESDYEGDCFDSNGILQTVCGITAADGKRWVAFNEDLGEKNGVIESIRSYGADTEKPKPLADGDSIVLVLE